MSLRILHYADVENAYDDPDRIGRLAGLVEELRDEETIVCGSGDNTGPGVLSVVTRGRQALDFYEAIEPDADTFGNHDFDHGPDAMREIVDASSFPWVCANAVLDGDVFAAVEGTTPWTVVETGGHRVGVVGVAHPATVDINPYAAPVEFTAPISAAREGVEALHERDVDRIAVLSHLGDDTQLARAVDADVILGGHDHETGIDHIDGTLVCRPGGNGRYVLEVSFDGDRPRATHHPVPDGPLDADVAAALRNRMEAAGLTDVVGVADEPVYCDMMASKRGESELGNLVTDAFRWRTGADVAVYSSGAFRRQPPLDGEVTAFDLVGVDPFPRDLVVVRVDGTALLATFEHVAFDQFDDAPEWFFGHVSGAELVWDDALGELKRARVGGASVDPDATYEVATSEFSVENVQLFPAFGPEDVVDRYGLGYETIVDYVREEGIAPELEGRIRRPTLDEDAVPERDWPNSP